MDTASEQQIAQPQAAPEAPPAQAPTTEAEGRAAALEVIKRATARAEGESTDAVQQEGEGTAQGQAEAAPAEVVPAEATPPKEAPPAEQTGVTSPEQRQDYWARRIEQEKRIRELQDQLKGRVTIEEAAKMVQAEPEKYGITLDGLLDRYAGAGQPTLVEVPTAAPQPAEGTPQQQVAAEALARQALEEARALRAERESELKARKRSQLAELEEAQIKQMAAMVGERPHIRQRPDEALPLALRIAANLVHQAGIGPQEARNRLSEIYTAALDTAEQHLAQEKARYAAYIPQPPAPVAPAPQQQVLPQGLAPSLGAQQQATPAPRDKTDEEIRAEGLALLKQRIAQSAAE